MPAINKVHLKNVVVEAVHAKTYQRLLFNYCLAIRRIQDAVNFGISDWNYLRLLDRVYEER